MDSPVTVRHLLLAFLVIATAIQSPAAHPPASSRTILNLPNFPLQALRLEVGRKLYSSLAISPVSAWVMARAAVVNGHTMGAQIVHSEGNGVYDKMLLEMANGYTITGQNTTETRLAKDTLNVHLLVYEVKDGKMAVCFSHNDDARYNGVGQIGTAWVGVLQGGKWVTISGTDRRKWGGRRGSE
ncbi:MAG: hypothetical protein DMF06_06070 [Verrucomicrobia bacterium]|nr:MAG: hypothetical protein DMF06_06070 [Verrucomicrobiota bacterium]